MMIHIQQNTSLKKLNTFGIDVNAQAFVSIANEKELITVLENNKLPLFILSGGSNMLLTEDVNALVIHINNKGISTKEINDQEILVTAKAGENWHDFVQHCIQNNWGGLENLSLIPGCVGSSPIQNIGAYGVELKDCFISCQAIDTKTFEKTTFNLDSCKFGYRDSIFKNEAKNQYIITEVTFKLSTKNHNFKTSYGAIEAELNKQNITVPTVKDISKAVISIRQSKLPDPKVIGNSGSFFKNPIIERSFYEDILKEFPEMPHYPISETSVKVPAGWLIDKAGLKGFSKGNAAVHNKQALVLVNKTGNASGKEILNLARFIQNSILEKYGIHLEMEVNIF